MSSDEYTEKRHRAILLRAWSVLEVIQAADNDDPSVPYLAKSVRKDVDLVLEDIAKAIGADIPLPRVRE